MASAALAIPTVAPYDPHRKWKVDHAGRIDKLAFEVTVGVFCGLATLLCAFRFGLRLKLRHKLFIDDAFVLVGLLSLISATGVLYHYMESMFRLEAINLDPTVVFSLSEILQLIYANKWFDIYLALMWTATFAIKASFLAFFRNLIRDVSRRLERYWWFVVIFTIITWIFLVVEPIILCPHFGMAAMQCFPNTKWSLNIGLTSMVTILDIATDVMVVSIPVVVLKMSGLKLGQKIGIAVFLCLSIVMIIITLIRMIGSIRPSLRSEHDGDITWQIFWQYMEGSVAVLMGSVTAFRGIFAGQMLDASTDNPGSSGRLRQHIRGWFRSSQRERGLAPLGSDSGEVRAPVIAEDSMSRATLKGLRTFIRRYNRDPGNTTIDTNPQMSQMSYDPLEDYHNFQRQQGGRPSEQKGGQAHSLREWAA